jgi:hypothetical protein
MIRAMSRSTAAEGRFPVADGDEKAVEAAKERLDQAWLKRTKDWGAVERALDDMQVALQRLAETHKARPPGE